MVASCEHIPSFVFHESRVTQLLCVHERARRRSDAVVEWLRFKVAARIRTERALGRLRAPMRTEVWGALIPSDDISASPWVRLCATETKWREERRKVANLACRINLHCPARPLQSAHTSQIPLPVDSTTVSLSSSRTTAVTKRLLSEKNNNKKNKLTVPRGAREDEKFLIWTRSLKEEKY